VVVDVWILGIMGTKLKAGVLIQMIAPEEIGVNLNLVAAHQNLTAKNTSIVIPTV